MSHKLDFIKPEHIVKALTQIDTETVPKSNQWSEYWITYDGKLYQFKYVVALASSFTSTPIKTRAFSSNHSSRNYIASLGFHIVFKTPTVQIEKTNYWAGASYYGIIGNQTNMLSDFIKESYWRTDHDLTKGEGLKILNELKQVKINDRLCIRYLDKKGGNISVEAMGTVNSIKEINDGKLGIIWDYNAPKYFGKTPAGAGSGNWWKTLIQVTRNNDIATIFGEAFASKRAARLAWNDFGWVMPSGKYGKSKHLDSHEAKYGYGHEEWLLDTSKLIKDYHYGFLEPIRKEQDAFSGKVYDVWLYSIHGESKKRFWIGEIKNLIVIEKTEAEKVKQIYINNGWFKEMTEQIKATGANKEGFSNWKGIDLFNVKFKPEDIAINDPYFEIPATHPIVEQSRYSFVHFKPSYNLINSTNLDNFAFGSSEEDIDDTNPPKSKIHIRKSKPVEIEYLHKAISDSLTNVLKQKYGKLNVTREHAAGYGANKIDIVMRDRNDLTFFEIKTYNSLKTSVREAVGQLLEYCFYPDKQKAKELIIVTQLPADQSTKLYFKHLRNTLKLRIYYQHYDIKTKMLSEKY